MPRGLWLLAQKPPPPPTPDDYKRAARADGESAAAVMASLPDPDDPKQLRRDVRNDTMIFREMSRQLSGGDFLHWLKKHWDTNLKRDKYRAAMKRVKEAVDAFVKSIKKGGFGSHKLLTDLEQAKQDAEKARKELQKAIFAEQEAAMGGLVECGPDAAEWCTSKNHDKCKELDCSEDECECTLYYAWFGGTWEPKEQEKIRKRQGSTKKAGGGGGGGGGQQGAKPPGVEPGPQPGPGKHPEKESGDVPRGESRQYAPDDKPPPPLKASPMVSPSGTTSTQGGELAAATRAPDGLALYASQPVAGPSRSVATENPCLPYWTLAGNILASLYAKRGASMPKPTVGDGAMTVSVADEAMRGTFESLYQSDAAKLGRPPSECVRVVVRAGTPGAPKGSKAEQQPPGAGSSEPAGTSEPAYCLTCVEALAVAAHLSTEAAIRCLWKAADLAGLTRDINPNTADRTWLLTELKVRCAALHSTARPRPQLEGFFQDPGKNTDPKAGTGTEPWDHKRTYARCKDDQFYYILVYDAAPWASRDAGEPDFSDDERKAYTQAVEDFRKRLDNQTYPKGHPKAGEKVYPGGGSYPGGGKVLNFQAKREVLETSLLGPDKIRVDWKTYRMEGLEEVSGDQALLEIKAGAHDPCMRALIFIGHGAAGAQKLGPYHLSVNGLLGSSEGRKTMFGDYDHRLDLYVSGTCKGAEEKEGEYEKQETTALTDNYVATNSSISVKELADMLGKVDLPVPKQP